MVQIACLLSCLEIFLQFVCLFLAFLIAHILEICLHDLLPTSWLCSLSLVYLVAQAFLKVSSLFYCLITCLYSRNLLACFLASYLPVSCLFACLSPCFVSCTHSYNLLASFPALLLAFFLAFCLLAFLLLCSQTPSNFLALWISFILASTVANCLLVLFRSCLHSFLQLACLRSCIHSSKKFWNFVGCLLPLLDICIPTSCILHSGFLLTRIHTNSLLACFLAFTFGGILAIHLLAINLSYLSEFVQYDCLL